MYAESTVSDVASLCGLDRNKVGYWVRSGKLHAKRSGKKYLIPHEELLFFLKSSGLKVPDSLSHGGTAGPAFRMFQNCWEYWHGDEKKGKCGSCVAFRNRWKICFTTREVGSTLCQKECHDCAYYLETYMPRIGFIHQFDCAAAVYKDLILWGVNREFSGLFQKDAKEFIGMGIEQVLHPDSLESLIKLEKSRVLGNRSVPMRFPVRLKSGVCGKAEALLSIQPLHEPREAFCLLFEMDRGQIPHD